MIGNTGITGFVSAGGGGGGGTPDFSTPYHFVFKGDNDSFYDTEATYESGARKTVDTSLIKEYFQEDGIYVYKKTLNTDGQYDEFVVLGVLTQYQVLRKLYGDVSPDFEYLVGAGMQQMQFMKDGGTVYIRIGDIANTDPTIPQIELNEAIKLLTLRASNLFINSDLGNINIANLLTFTSDAAAASYFGLAGQVYIYAPSGLPGAPKLLSIT